MSARDLALEAFRFDLSERAELAQRILDSLEEMPAAELEKSWANEAQRRDRPMDRGQLSSVSASDVMARLRGEIGCARGIRSTNRRKPSCAMPRCNTR